MERPTINTDIEANNKLNEKRKRAWKKIIKSALYISKTDKQKVSYILHKWRKKQRKLLGQKDIEDPNPFDKTYVFYCLDT